MTAGTDTARPSGANAKVRERNLTRLQAHLASERARTDFAATLDALEDKLNVPKQVGIRVDRARVRLRTFADEQPVAAIVVAVGVVAAVGVGVWLFVRANLDR